MHGDNAGHDFPAVEAAAHRVLWNDQNFETLLPVRRKYSVVRTQPVTTAKRREYEAHGWPRELILLKEHRVKLVGRRMTLALTTNAPEAEFELPDKIITPARDLGTYLGASLFWQGREDRALVSARLNSLRDIRRIAALASPQPPPAAAAPPPSTDPVIQHLLASALRVLKSGLLVTNAELPAKMTDDEKILANFLLSTRDDDTRRPLSLAEIGKVLNCSDEAIRRRQSKLEKRFPALVPVIRVFRSRNHKGEPVSPLRPHHHDDPDDAA